MQTIHLTYCKVKILEEYWDKIVAKIAGKEMIWKQTDGECYTKEVKMRHVLEGLERCDFNDTCVVMLTRTTRQQ